MENVQTLWDIFCVVIGVAAIGGGLYWTAKRIGLTTFIKGLVGFMALGFLGYCAFKAFPTVWAFVAPWMGIIIILLIIWGVLKLIGLVR